MPAFLFPGSLAIGERRLVVTKAPQVLKFDTSWT